ncbi:MAG: clostripain-related cysteine peptidase [Thermoplasmata archaeon]
MSSIARIRGVACALVIVAMLSVSFNAAAGNQNNKTNGTASWNVLVYLTADNNLDSLTEEDLDELMAVGSNAYMNVLALVDRYADAAHVYKVEMGSLTELSVSGLSGVEVNMGASGTLKTFMSFVNAKYPADHTLLFFWDHGTPLLGVGVDEHTGTAAESDWLSHAEVVEALSGTKVDILATDECLQGQIEVVYEYYTRGLQSDYVIGSEGYIGWRGFPYDAILQHIVDQPAISSKDLSLAIVQEFAALFSEPPYMSEVVTAQAVVELRQVGNVVWDLKVLADLLTDDIASYTKAITSARGKSMLIWGEYGAEAQVDLTTLVRSIGKSAPVGSEVRSACEALLSDLDQAIIATGTTMVTAKKDFNGLGIFFPSTYMSYQNHLWTASEMYEDMAFAGVWLPFLEAYWGIAA